MTYSFGANPSTTSSRSANIVFTGAFPSGGTFTLTQNPATSTLPNLTPYQTAGWTDKIIISNVAGTSLNSGSFTANDNLYAYWAFQNNGGASASSLFYIDLLVDGNLVAYWYVDPALDPNYYVYVAD